MQGSGVYMFILQSHASDFIFYSIFLVTGRNKAVAIQCLEEGKGILRALLLAITLLEAIKVLLSSSLGP